MHSYSTDSSERITLPFYIAVLSILSAWFLPKILEYSHLTIPWWFDAPAVMGFYVIYHKIFDNIAWKWFHKIGIVKTPNMSGIWEGHFLSSYDRQSEQKPAILEIKQTWTRVRIVFKNGTSRSNSINSSIITEKGEGIILSYEYQNEPFYNAVDTMQIHKGFTRLNLSRNGNELEGEYFTGRGRLNYGTMNFSKRDIE